MKQVVGVLVVGVASLLAAVGCGSSDSGSGGGAGAPGTGGAGSGAAGAGSGGSAVAQCKALLEGYCARSATCVTQLACEPGMTEAQEHDDCVAAVGAAIDCAQAVAVTATYDACISKVGAIDCSAYGAPPACMVADLPPECEGVILVGQ